MVIKAIKNFVNIQILRSCFFEIKLSISLKITFIVMDQLKYWVVRCKSLGKFMRLSCYIGNSNDYELKIRNSAVFHIDWNINLNTKIQCWDGCKTPQWHPTKNQKLIGSVAEYAEPCKSEGVRWCDSTGVEYGRLMGEMIEIGIGTRNNLRVTMSFPFSPISSRVASTGHPTLDL